MKLRVFEITAIACLILISGCAGKNHIPLAKSYKDKNISTDFVILQTQNEIRAEIKRSNVASAMGGGIIPALIDIAVENSRASDAEDIIQPVKNALADYKMEDRLLLKLEPVLNGAPWFQKILLKLVQGEEEKFLDQALNTTASDSVGVIKPQYSLSPDFSSLNSQITFSLYLASKNSRDQDSQTANDRDPIYKTVVRHSYSLPLKSNNEEANSKIWSASGGRRIKEAFDDSISALIFKLKNDLKDPFKEH